MSVVNAVAIDPDALALAARFARHGIPSHDRLGVLRARTMLEGVTRLQPEPVVVGEVRDLLLPGADGRLPARLYAPAGAARGPVVLYLHGGGWVLGSIAAADGPCRELAAAGARVVSLGYRLAPETPFPGPLHDCLSAARALLDEPERVGAAPGDGVILLGDSAGGNLAAACAHALRGKRPGAVHAQILLYPCLHPARESPFASYAEHADAPLMTARELAWFWDLYAGDPARARDPRAAPLLDAELTGLPPTTVLLAGVDPLHDEGVAYAERLRDAGVPVALRVWADQPHGFWWMGAALPRAHELTEAILAAIGDAGGLA